MKEINYPSCGQTFTLDEAGYADILGNATNYEALICLVSATAVASLIKFIKESSN